MNLCERNEDRLLSQIDGVVREAVMALSPLGDGEIPSQIQPHDSISNSEFSTTAPQLSGEDLGALISDAFEKHLPDPSVLVEPAQIYAEQLTQAALEKLTPLTTIVRDSVEGVSEARLSLQDQAQVIRSSMEGLSTEINQSISDLEPLLERLGDRGRILRVDSEQHDQLLAMVDLKQSLDALNTNLERISTPKPFLSTWRRRLKI